MLPILAVALPVLAALLAALALVVPLLAGVVVRLVRPMTLALGFAAAVAMWAAGYVAMMAPGLLVGEVLFAICILCVPAVAFIAGRRRDPGTSGVQIGAVAAFVNLLVVGSLFGGGPRVGVEVLRHGAPVKAPLFLPGASTDASQDGAVLGMVLDAPGADGGAVVTEVRPGSPAHDAGLERGDVLIRVDGRPGATVAALSEAISREQGRRRSLAGEGAAWVSGLFGVCLFLGAVGFRMGRSRPVSAPLPDPVSLFAAVTAGAILLLLITGGLVTGMEAGLAVPDWPNSFGHNMLLYPLSEMKGGIYWEHAHRLFGMLVGLCAAVLLALSWRRGGGVRWLALALYAMVVAQGVMGGLRVTGFLSLASQREALSPNLTLAIVHGVFGQLVFGGAALVAAASSTTWRGSTRAVSTAVGPSLLRWTPVLVACVVLQLILGACERHLQVPGTEDAPARHPAWALHPHIALAFGILGLALFTGLRAKSLAGEGLPVLPRLGRLIHALVGLQILLGGLALVAVIVRRSPVVPTWEVAATSAHQAMGAMVLGVSVLLAAWSMRLLSRAGGTRAAVTPPASPA